MRGPKIVFEIGGLDELHTLLARQEELTRELSANADKLVSVVLNIQAKINQPEAIANEGEKPLSLREYFRICSNSEPKRTTPARPDSESARPICTEDIPRHNFALSNSSDSRQQTFTANYFPEGLKLVLVPQELFEALILNNRGIIEKFWSQG